jgi:hypothetical protein
MIRRDTVRAWLERRDIAFTIYASLAAFCAYSSMYGFRKPFTSAQFTGLEFFGMDYKTIVVIAQVFGYMLSKGIGIKIVSELTSLRRPVLMLMFMGVAEAALALFAVVPAPWNAVFLFLNGLPLGMIWGIVFGYIEGRKRTDIIALVLCSTFILASGFAKTVGKAVLNWGVSEVAMPFVAGLLFALPLLGSLWMLESLPPPTDEDRALRTERVPMDRVERKRFFLAFAPGFLLLLVAYILLTAFRDFRDNYMADIWQTLGLGASSAIFTKTEAPIAIAVLVVLAVLLVVRDNFKALVINHLAVGAGFIIVGGTTFLYRNGAIGPVLWMALVGFGLFLGYIPFNGVLFDRLIAAFAYKSNAGYLIYVADFLGYLASVAVLVYKSIGQKAMTHVVFFIDASYVLSVVGVVTMAASLAYFVAKRRSMQRRPG